MEKKEKGKTGINPVKRTGTEFFTLAIIVVIVALFSLVVVSAFTNPTAFQVLENREVCEPAFCPNPFPFPLPGTLISGSHDHTEEQVAEYLEGQRECYDDLITSIENELAPSLASNTIVQEVVETVVVSYSGEAGEAGCTPGECEEGDTGKICRNGVYFNAGEEICGNGTDDDCDGLIDEDAENDPEGTSCYTDCSEYNYDNESCNSQSHCYYYEPNCVNKRDCSPCGDCLTQSECHSTLSQDNCYWDSAFDECTEFPECADDCSCSQNICMTIQEMQGPCYFDEGSSQCMEAVECDPCQNCSGSETLCYSDYDCQWFDWIAEDDKCQPRTCDAETNTCGLCTVEDACIQSGTCMWTGSECIEMGQICDQPETCSECDGDLTGCQYGNTSCDYQWQCCYNENNDECVSCSMQCYDYDSGDLCQNCYNDEITCNSDPNCFFNPDDGSCQMVNNYEVYESCAVHDEVSCGVGNPCVWNGESCTAPAYAYCSQYPLQNECESDNRCSWDPEADEGAGRCIQECFTCGWPEYDPPCGLQHCNNPENPDTEFICRNDSRCDWDEEMMMCVTAGGEGSCGEFCEYCGDPGTCSNDPNCFWDDYTGCKRKCSDFTSQGECSNVDYCCWSNGLNSCVDEGVSWGETCSNLPELTEEICELDSDCAWDSALNRCKPDTCLRFDQADCDTITGCNWNGSECVSTVCSGLTEVDCADYPDECYWDQLFMECFPLHCSDVIDSTTCNNRAECTWNADADETGRCVKECFNCGSSCEQVNECYNNETICRNDPDCVFDLGYCSLPPIENCSQATNQNQCSSTEDCCWIYEGNYCVDRYLSCGEDCSSPLCNTEAACNDDSDCGWDSALMQCKPDPCLRFDDESDCQYYPDCMWDYGNNNCRSNPCYGAVDTLDCQNFYPDECYWDSTFNECLPLHCSQITNDNACQDRRECRWNWESNECAKQCFTCDPDCGSNPSCTSSQIVCENDPNCDWDGLTCGIPAPSYCVAPNCPDCDGDPANCFDECEPIDFPTGESFCVQRNYSCGEYCSNPECLSESNYCLSDPGCGFYELDATCQPGGYCLRLDQASCSDMSQLCYWDSEALIYPTPTCVPNCYQFNGQESNCNSNPLCEYDPTMDFCFAKRCEKITDSAFCESVPICRWDYGYNVCTQYASECSPAECGNCPEYACNAFADCSWNDGACESLGGTVCGDGVCDYPEEDELSCPIDCECFCGDGYCNPDCESPMSCPVDCGGDVCGDGICGPTESPASCPSDCGGAVCGDGICDEPEEDYINCPVDCPPPVCGNDVCETGEDPESCPQDCACGDMICQSEYGEDPFTCPADCDPAVPVEWTCYTHYYEDGFCDCGCGVMDPDCPDLTVDVCEYCDSVGACNEGQSCPGLIDPENNAVCLAPECEINEDCDDGDPCTYDYCNNAICYHTVDCSLDPSCDGLPCDDEDLCTENDECVGGVCEGTPLDCGDGDPCTNDYCDPSEGICFNEYDCSLPGCYTPELCEGLDCSYPLDAGTDLDLPNSFTGSNTGKGNNFSPDECYRGDAEDVVFEFEVTGSVAEFTFDTIGSDYDTVLYIRDVCDDDLSEIACNDDYSGLQSSLTTYLDPGIYYVIVDGYSSSSAGTYTLTIQENV